MSQRGKWSEEETSKLLKLIAASPAIYNPYDHRYHDRFLKDTIWSSIGYKMKKSVDMCKKQWWYLRGSRKLDFLENMEYNKKTYKYRSRKRVSKISVVDTDESNSTVKKTSRVADSNKANDTVNKTSRLGNTGKSNRTVKKTSQIEVPLSIIAQMPKNTPAEHQNKEETQNKISKPQEKEDTMTTSFISYVTKTLSTLPPFLRVKARNEMLTVLTKFKLIAEGRDPCEILSIQPKNSQDSLSKLAELLASNMSYNLQNCLSKEIVNSQESVSGEVEQEQYTSSQSSMQDSSISKEGKQSYKIDVDKSPEESKLSVSEIRIKSEDFNVPDLKTKNNLKEFEESKMTTNTGLTNEILTKIKIKPEKCEITIKLEPGLSTEPGMSTEPRLSIEPGLSAEPETKSKIEQEEQVIKSEEGEMYIKSEPIDFPMSIEENIY